LKSDGRTVKAVDDVSFSIPKGETFCLVGESGSGKSITALSVMRLLPEGIASHPGGEILFNGLDILTQPEAALQQIRGSQIAMIFQEPMNSLNPVLTVGEQITEALQLHRPSLSDADAVERAMLALEQVQIPKARERFRDFPHQLSGGQRQRIGVARALYDSPSLVVLDEPNSNLDDLGEAALYRAMAALKERNTTVLVISHRPGILKLVDRILVMVGGTVAMFGDRQQVLTKMAQKTTTLPTKEANTK
jgi:peptide/nickel transport system ATP-binding protein